MKLPLTAMWKTATQFVVDYEDGEITIKALDAAPTIMASDAPSLN